MFFYYDMLLFCYLLCCVNFMLVFMCSKWLSFNVVCSCSVICYVCCWLSVIFKNWLLLSVCYLFLFLLILWYVVICLCWFYVMFSLFLLLDCYLSCFSINSMLFVHVFVNDLFFFMFCFLMFCYYLFVLSCWCPVI